MSANPQYANQPGYDEDGIPIRSSDTSNKSESASIAASATGYRLSNGYPAAVQDVIMGSAQSGSVTVKDGADGLIEVTPGAGLSMDLKGRKAVEELIVDTATSAACSVAWTKTGLGIVPTTFLVDGYGDSLMAPTVGYIGESLGLHTTKDLVFTATATGGDNLEEIKEDFLANYKASRVNRNVIEGGINNIVNLGADITSLQKMIDDASAMADLLIAKSDEPFAILGISPFGPDAVTGHANYTADRNQKALDYNAAMLAKYPNNFVDTYALLGDPATPNQLADWAYKEARTDLHPNKDANRIMDAAIAAVIFPEQTPYDTTEPVGNVLGSYRDLSGWTANANAQLGGHTITLADGQTDTGTKGLLPSASDTASIKEFQKNTTSTPALNDKMEFSAVFQPGTVDWVWIQCRDGAGLTHQRYVNIVTATAGTLGGTGSSSTIEINKTAHGWLEVKITYTNTASGVNNVTIRSSSNGTATTSDAHARISSGDDYPTDISIDCVALSIL